MTLTPKPLADPAPKGRGGPTVQERFARAREDFGLFVSLVHTTDMPGLWHGQALPAQHHDRMIAALTDDSLGHTLIVAPRGSGKTSLVQAWLEWRLGRASEGLDGMGKHWQNDFRVIYFSNTAHQAYRVSNAIKATIESNDYYQAIFPKVKKHSEKWSQEEWKVKGNTVKDANFQALGVGGPALGARALIIVFDDIADQENMSTQLQRENVRLWLDQTAVPILVPWGRMVMSCTRWAWEDPAAWAEERGWHTLLLKALSDEDESYWPERFPAEFLKERRRENPRAFAKQYQNEVTPEEGLIFKREWFEPRFDLLPAPETCRMKIHSWDTAAGQGRNRSYSAGWRILVTEDWHYYFFDLLRGQFPYAELRESVRSLAQTDNPTWVIIEKKSSGHSLLQDDRLAGIPLVEWQPFGQKGSATRVEANDMISSVCAAGRVHLPSEWFCRRVGAEWLHQAERELFSYGDGSKTTDDVVDAMCQAIFWLEEQRVRSTALRPSGRYLPQYVTPAGGRPKAAV